MNMGLKSTDCKTLQSYLFMWLSTIHSQGRRESVAAVVFGLFNVTCQLLKLHKRRRIRVNDKFNKMRQKACLVCFIMTCRKCLEELSKDTETLSRNTTLQDKDLNPVLNNGIYKLFYHKVRVRERNGQKCISQKQNFILHISQAHQ